MNTVKMYDNTRVITWVFPEPIVSEKTVELITQEEQTIFNEFMFTCITAIGSAITLMF